MLGSTIYQPTHNSLDINKNSVEYVKQRSALFGFSKKPRKNPLLTKHVYSICGYLPINRVYHFKKTFWYSFENSSTNVYS